MKLAKLVQTTGEQEVVIQLLCQLLNVDRTALLMLDEINDTVARQILQLVDKYKNGTPLAYLTHQAYFDGRAFYVNKHVLIPRFDTEILLEVAEKEIIAATLETPKSKPYRILDLCCGSGILGISLSYLTDWLREKSPNQNFEIYAIDISKQALQVAQINAKAHECDGDIVFVQSDLFEKIDTKFDLIVCNPPYIRSQEIGVEDKSILQEPHIALDGGLDGLYYYRRILNDVDKYLTAEGVILFEVGYDQAADVTEIAMDNGFEKITGYKDLANYVRVVKIKR